MILPKFYENFMTFYDMVKFYDTFVILCCEGPLSVRTSATVTESRIPRKNILATSRSYHAECSERAMTIHRLPARTT